MTEEKLVGFIGMENKEFVITSSHIIVLNKLGEKIDVFLNRNIINFMFVDGTWIYALKNTATSYDNKAHKAQGTRMRPGFFVYDVNRMLEGAIEVHKLEDAMVGSQDYIDFDFETQTIAFLKDLSAIHLMPLIHRNTLKFFGMDKKSNYLIWRQQDGIFTAVNKKLKITMWSTVSGKILSQQTDAIDDYDPTEPISMMSKLKRGMKA